jgi:hypothetical protein
MIRGRARTRPKEKVPPESGPEPDADDRRDDRISAATVAKWLIPSATALFVCIGYIIQSAQQDLLGLHYSDSETSTLFISATDFLKYLGATPFIAISNLVTGQRVSLGGYGIVLWSGLILVVLVLADSRISRFRYFGWFRGIWPLSAALMILMAGKFILLDEPLFQVRGIILSEFVARPMADSQSRTFLERLNENAGGQMAEVRNDTHARRILANIVCSRISRDAAIEDRAREVATLCEHEQERYLEDRTGLFLAQVWSALLIAILAIALLRRRNRSHFHIVLALIALSYTLFVPYVFGKLERSTYFDFGTLRVAESLRKAEDDSGEQAAIQQGLVLSRNASGVVLLVARVEPCSTAVGAAEASYSRVTLSFLAPSQILAVERISRLDVVAWAFLNERHCPSIQAPLQAP